METKPDGIRALIVDDEAPHASVSPTCSIRPRGSSLQEAWHGETAVRTILTDGPTGPSGCADA